MIAVAVGTLAGAAARRRGRQVARPRRPARDAALDPDRAGEEQDRRRERLAQPGFGEPGNGYPDPDPTGLGQGQYCREYQQTITVGGEDRAGLRTRLPAARRVVADRRKLRPGLPRHPGGCPARRSSPVANREFSGHAGGPPPPIGLDGRPRHRLDRRHPAARAALSEQNQRSPRDVSIRVRS